LFGHVVYKEGMLMDLTNIAIIVDLPPPNSLMQLRTILGHTCYYRKFIRGYAEIATPMEKLLKKYEKFQWNEKCQKILDMLKEKMFFSSNPSFS